MGWLRRISHLMGLARQTVQLAPNAHHAVTGVTSPSHALPASFTPLTPAPRDMGVMLQREEILDRRNRLAGYRLSCDWLGGGQHQRVTQAQFDQALQACQARQQAQRRLVVIELPLGTDMAGLAQAWCGPQSVLHVRLPFRQDIPAAVMVELEGLRTSACGLALSWAEVADARSPLWRLATHAVIDYSAMSVEQFERLSASLRREHPQLLLLVDHVHTWPEQRLCVANGAEFTMGRFLTTRDELDRNERINDSRMVVLEMLNAVRQDCAVDTLADMAKRDPGIAVHLLELANSPFYGLRRPLTGVDEAITLLGRETLYRWLAISTFKLGEDPHRDQALLEVALARAKLLELCAQSTSSKQQADELFLVGLLSLIDALLGVPMCKLLEKMSLPQAVKQALLDNDGPYAPYLALSIAIERCQSQRIVQLAQGLGVSASSMPAWRDEALLWAEAAAH